MKASDVIIGDRFCFKGMCLVRVLFEGRQTVTFRCTDNIIALANSQVYFIPCNAEIETSDTD